MNIINYKASIIDILIMLALNNINYKASIIDLDSLFGTLSLNDIPQAFIYLLSLPNFMDFHVFHGYPHILRFYIYFHETY